MRTFRFALLVSAASVLWAAPARDPGVARAQAALARLPMRFEANLGQWTPAVRYAARAGDYAALFTAAGPAFSFGSQRVDISLEGSNPAPQIDGLDQMPTRTNYFVGSKDRWRTGVPNYSRVRYRGVYPGVDVVYYGSGGRLEYDFLLQPGADPASIRLRFQGAGRTSISPQGDLQVDCANGRLIQKQALIYQEDAKSGARRRIAGRYALLADGAVAFQVGKYDRSKPLVIDPSLVFASYYGSSAADQINAVKIGSSGRLYVVGNTLGTDWAATSTAYATGNVALGAADLFIMTLDTTASGNFAIQYLSYLGGSADDTPAGIDVDASGNLYIAGTTTSSDFPMAGNSVIATAPSTTGSVFVVQFNPALSGKDALVYSTFLGGSGTNRAGGIGVDAQGMIYVIGTTTSTDFPVTDSAYAGVIWGTQDAFLCKIDPNSTTLAYSTYLGGDDVDEGRAIAVSPAGLVYFAITTLSTQFELGPAPWRAVPFGREDTVVGLMDMTKTSFDSLVWDTYFGGSDTDEVRKLSFDANGRVLMTGFTFSNDFPTTYDAVQTAASGNGDAFVSIVDPSHPASFLVYSTYLGGSQGEVAYDIAGDASGSVYVTGYTLSGDFPMSADAIQSQWGGGSDVFVAKLRPGSPGASGLEFSTYLGGFGIHVPTSLTLSQDGTVYVGGFSNPGLQTTGASALPYAGGYTDGFIVALSQLAGQALRTNKKSTPRAPRFIARPATSAPRPGRMPEK